MNVTGVFENGSLLTAIYICVGFRSLYLLGKALQAFTQAADACFLFWYTWFALPTGRGIAFVYRNTYGRKINNPDLDTVIVNQYSQK
uniref:3c protein n=1 Tax=Bird gammacoronavirus AnasCN24 TaxID=3237959 RepID=A0AB39ADS8_9GAMC